MCPMGRVDRPPVMLRPTAPLALKRLLQCGQESAIILSPTHGNAHEAPSQAGEGTAITNKHPMPDQALLQTRGIPARSCDFPQ
jgi:hypothetical protein